jgi:hypothetical protein
MNKLILWLEKFGPLAIGAIVLVLLIWFRADVRALAADKKIDVSALFGAIFGWASIQTGFLFSVYGFIASKTDGFVGALGATRSMALFKRYTMRAMLIGFVLTILTIPLIVTGNQGLEGIRYVLTSAWFAIFAWAFAAFLRVAVNFGQIVSVRDRTSIPGGE